MLPEADRANLRHHLQSKILNEPSSVKIIDELMGNMQRLRSLKSRQDKGELSASGVAEADGLLLRNRDLAATLEGMLSL